MLTRLVIHDVVLIEKLALQLEPGLNVFTGETGAVSIITKSNVFLSSAISSRYF